MVSEIRGKQAESVSCWLPETFGWSRDDHYRHGVFTLPLYTGCGHLSLVLTALFSQSQSPQVICMVHAQPSWLLLSHTFPPFPFDYVGLAGLLLLVAKTVQTDIFLSRNSPSSVKVFWALSEHFSIYWLHTFMPFPASRMPFPSKSCWLCMHKSWLSFLPPLFY